MQSATVEKGNYELTRERRRAVKPSTRQNNPKILRCIPPNDELVLALKYFKQ